MDNILIRGLKIEAKHGVHEEEKRCEQPFVLDLDLVFGFYRAAQTDNLDDTVNYSAVCNLIAETVKNNTFSLIEKLAYECAFSVMEKFPADGLKLTLWKPCAPVKHKFGNVGVSVELARKKAYLSLGSSVGDRAGYLDFAVDGLNKTRGIEVKKVSSYMESEPYGGVAENRFLNCAVEIETFLSPRALLGEIHRIEKEGGRERKIRWGDRTLDIDIVFFGNKEINEDGLCVPHPEYKKRDFVLKPLKEIAPDFVCPVTKKRLRDM